jgi:hypothetical protein
MDPGGHSFDFRAENRDGVEWGGQEERLRPTERGIASLVTKYILK